MEISFASLKRSLDSINASPSSPSSSSSSGVRPLKRSKSAPSRIKKLKRSMETALIISSSNGTGAFSPPAKRYRNCMAFNNNSSMLSSKRLFRFSRLKSSMDGPKRLLHLGGDLLTTVFSYIWDEFSSFARISYAFSTGSFARKLGVRSEIFGREVSSKEARTKLLCAANLLRNERIIEAASKNFSCVVRCLAQKLDQRLIANALWKAIARGNMAVVMAILDSPNFDIHCFNEKSLVVAVANGQVDIVKALIDRGADVTAAGSHLLHIAVVASFKKTNNLGLLRVLIEAGNETWNRAMLSEALKYCLDSSRRDLFPSHSEGDFLRTAMLLKCVGASAEAPPECDAMALEK